MDQTCDWQTTLPPVQRRELARIDRMAETIARQLQAHPLLARAVLERFDPVLRALHERPDLHGLVRQQLQYGPPGSTAACNVLTGGFGGV